MEPLCFVVLEIWASLAPETSFSASHSCSEPFSRPPAMMPRGCVSSGGPHARSWNLQQTSQHMVLESKVSIIFPGKRTLSPRRCWQWAEVRVLALGYPG